MPKARPASRNPNRTRRRLLHAAIRLFSAKGYHAVSVDQIVGAARVNKRMVYHYFGCKEHLYIAALHEVYKRLERVEFLATEATGDPRQQLTRLIKSYFGFLEDNPEFVQMLQWENLERGRHIAKIDHLLTKNPFLDRFRQIIAEGVRAGQFRSDLNIPHLLIHFIGLCFIYHSNRYSLSQGLEIDLTSSKVLAEGRRQAVALVFQGIGTAQAARVGYARQRGRFRSTKSPSVIQG
jgi:AcrR family transcriptional regulator